ncbi:MAG: hypothetical protein ACTHMT_09630 [Verrucomicrobiota bacterium]
MEVLAHIDDDARLTFPLPLPEVGPVINYPNPVPEDCDKSLELAGSDFLLGC